MIGVLLTKVNRYPDEVKVDELSRGFEKLADGAEQKLKDYCDGTMPAEETQKFSTLFPNIDCKEVNKSNK